MRNLVGVAAVFLSLCGPASAASFIPNRSAWDRLTESEKQWYLAGYSDYELTVVSARTPEYVALLEGLRTCMAEQLPNGSDLVRLVDEGYAGHAEMWAMNPGYVLSNETAKLCRPYISKARAARGLPALK